MLTVTSHSAGTFQLYLPVLLVSLVNFIIYGALIYLFILLIRALRKYLNESNPRPETVAVRKSLGEAIKENRARCSMTQEFVAEQLGVSRQAVSKWENGTSDPSTSNLLALARLFGISAEELLKSVQP